MKKVLKIINFLLENKYFPLTMIIIAVLFVTFYSFTTSPLYVIEGMDSGVFKSMGLAITQGKIPYVDYFDHKGPVLYFINALGQWILQGRWGIFLLQLIALSISFIYLFKTARLFLNGWQSCLLFCIVLIFLGGIYQEGNQCEEWILAIVSPCLFYIMSDIVKGEVIHMSPLYGLLYGLCFALAFYIRPNDAIAILGGALGGAIIYAIVYKKLEISTVVYDILSFLGVFLIITLIICSYFVYYQSFDSFVYGLFIHNSLYAGGIKTLLLSCLNYRKIVVFIIWLALWDMVYNTKYKNILFALIPICIFQYVLMGKFMFPHYFIGYSVLFLLYGIFMFKQKRFASVILYLSLLYCSAYAGETNWYRLSKEAIQYRIKMIKSQDIENKLFYVECDKLLDMVPANMQDSIWNYNLMWGKNPASSIFFHYGITQCNKVPYYYMYCVDEHLKAIDDIKQYTPLYVVLTHTEDKDTTWLPIWAKYTDDYRFIDANYEFVAATDSTICNLELYKRKE